MEKNNKVLIVDDEISILDSLSLLLGKYGYSTTVSCDPEKAFQKISSDSYGIVLTDINMPKMSGIELLEKIRTIDADIPVILMTAYGELDYAMSALKKGAFDFILKPFKPEILLYSLEKALEFNRLKQIEKNYTKSLEDSVKQKTQELTILLSTVKDLSYEIIQRLSAAAEFKDPETGAHIVRIGLYAQKIAQTMGLPKDIIETIRFASPMHDIGKIGIHDSILLKDGYLTPEEFEIMKKHTVIGEKILSHSKHLNIQMSSSIALNHHEKWDGTGYPNGLKGAEIPLESRITMLCDQYDALRSLRPYKNALSHRNTVEILVKGDGKTLPQHFDPDVLNAFIKIETVFEEIYNNSQNNAPPKTMRVK
ncbi:MAG: response regulator [Planctomycetes bacterium]|nr:response regulator [Planctomycetota bacterium]